VVKKTQSSAQQTHHAPGREVLSIGPLKGEQSARLEVATGGAHQQDRARAEAGKGRSGAQ